MEYCKCGNLVEVEKDVSSIKCWECTDVIYDLPKQQTSRELKTNQYYLVIAKNGFLLLTKFKPEAIIVSKWEGVIFSGIINKANHSIVYEYNGSEGIKKLKNIPVSKPYYQKLSFDFQTLEHTGIKKVTIENNIRSKHRKPYTY